MVLLTNFPPPTEGVRHCQINTTVDVDGKDLGNGTLYVTESCVSWQKNSTCTGFSLQYPGISLHAISRDLTSFPSECLYLMIDGKLPGTEEEKEANSSEDDEDSESKVTEIRFIPSDKDSLESMYRAMSACQALHPDPEDIDSEEEEEKYAYEEDDDDDVYEEEEGAAHLTPAGRARLVQFDTLLQGVDPGDVLPSANGYHRPASIVGTAGDGCSAGEPMELGQFQDADEME